MLTLISLMMSAGELEECVRIVVGKVATDDSSDPAPSLAALK